MEQSPIIQIPLDQITTSPFNRKVLIDRELKDLAASIKANDVLEPLTVRIVVVPDDPDSRGMNPYELIFGERRYRGAQIAGLETVPCRIIEADDVTVLQLQHEENTHRTNPNPLDTANNFEHLRTLGKSEPEIAAMYGVSRGYVYGLLGLQRASAEIREAVRKGEITASHAEILIPLKKDQVAAMLRFAIETRASVRQLQDRVRQVTRKPVVPKKRKQSAGPDKSQWQFNVAATILSQIRSFGREKSIAMIRRFPTDHIKSMLSGRVITSRENPAAITAIAKQYRVDVAKIKRETTKRIRLHVEKKRAD